VAAALDISGEESPEVIHAILRAAKTVAAGCGASLEVLYASPFDNAAPDAVKAHRESLCSYAASAGVRPDQVHIVMGDPVRSIPEFVAQQCYELLVLGALTHRKTMTALVGTLTGRLIESVRCDLLLVSCSRP
jgi:nucleotide-binding universal stress UspA family protein